MMKLPKEEPAFRANERPAQTKETNYTSILNNHSTGSKPKRPLYVVVVDFADQLLVAIFDGIGGLALWIMRGGRR